MQLNRTPGTNPSVMAGLAPAIRPMAVMPRIQGRPDNAVTASASLHRGQCISGRTKTGHDDRARAAHPNWFNR
jgi:hypothetical protein